MNLTGRGIVMLNKPYGEGLKWTSKRYREGKQVSHVQKKKEKQKEKILRRTRTRRKNKEMKNVA